MSRSKVSSLLHGVILLIAAMGPIGYFMEVRSRASTEALFTDALASAGAGRWVWDLKAENAGLPSLVWDDQMFVLFGRDKSKWGPNYGGFESCLLAADRARVRAICERTIAARGSYNDVFSVVTDDGAVRILRASGKVSKDGRFMTGLVLPSMQDPEFYPP